MDKIINRYDFKAQINISCPHHYSCGEKLCNKVHYIIPKMSVLFELCLDLKLLAMITPKITVINTSIV